MFKRVAKIDSKKQRSTVFNDDKSQDSTVLIGQSLEGQAHD